MKKILFAVSFLTLFTCLFAQNYIAFDSGYIASVKNNKCMKVADYPGKNVKPTELLKDKSCSVSSHDSSINTLIIVCDDKKAKKSIMYSYALSLDVCNDSLEIAKKRGY